MCCFLCEIHPLTHVECCCWFVLKFCIMLLRKYSTFPKSSDTIGCLGNTMHLFLHLWNCYTCDRRLLHNVVMHVWHCTVSHALLLLRYHACDKPVMFKTACSCDVIFYVEECISTHSCRALVCAGNPMKASHKFPVC